MALAQLKTGLDGSTSEIPKIWMDRRGFPYCAWVLNSSLRFARFGGIEWEYLGNPVVIASGVSGLPYKPICTNSIGHPSLIYRDTNDNLLHIYWDGEEWLSHGDGVIADSSSEGSSIIIRRDVEYVVYMNNVDSSRTIVIKRLDGSTWTDISSKEVPQQDVPASILVAGFQARRLHVFWGASSSDHSWIGASIYDLGSDTWENLPDSRIPSSATTGEISDIEFGVVDSNVSSSSSESS